MVLIILAYQAIRLVISVIFHPIEVWNQRTVHESFVRTLAVSYNSCLSKHSKLVTIYLYVALGARTVVKLLSFFAVVLLVWNGVPGTPFQGLQRPVGVPLLAIFGSISLPIFAIGFFQGWSKIGQWNNRRAERTSLLDDMPI